MEAKLDEISSSLTKLAITGNTNETDYDNETSENATDGSTDDTGSGTDNEDTEHELTSENKFPSMLNGEAEGNVSEPEESSAHASDGSDDEGTADTLTDDEDANNIDEADESEEIDAESQVADRGGGDAVVDPYRCLEDSVVVTVADDGTSCGTVKVKIVSKKRPHDPQAYRKWIQAKNEEIRRNRALEKVRAQQLEEEKRHEEQQRKEMNKSKFAQWLQRKKQQNTCGDTKPTPGTEKVSSSTQQFVQNDADVRFKTWLKRVKQRDEEKRAKEMLQKQREMEARNKKKKIAQDMYKEWFKSAKNKPRPVPLNQGQHTLRGTVSKIFVNPEPWQSNCD